MGLLNGILKLVQLLLTKDFTEFLKASADFGFLTKRAFEVLPVSPAAEEVFGHDIMSQHAVPIFVKGEVLIDVSKDRLDALADLCRPAFEGELSSSSDHSSLSLRNLSLPVT
ncbi:hypothetical protein MRX96_053432 [Rhipicephalus microplus]